ncbi:MAG: hypothetical protein J6P54_08850 [Bacteroidales bacterium]|nr:hypothetical protein [Bacteroidales bacterium]
MQSGVGDAHTTTGISKRCDRQGRLSEPLDSRISPICRDWSSPSVTTLRSACMVLIAPVGASHASGMFSETVCTPSLQSTVASLQS